MDNKRIRYVNRIITLDRINWDNTLTIWDKENINAIINEFDKHHEYKIKKR